MSRIYEALSESNGKREQRKRENHGQNVVTIMSHRRRCRWRKRPSTSSAPWRVTPRMPGTRLRFRQDGEGEYVAFRDGGEVLVPFRTRMTADIRGMREGHVRFSGPGISPALPSC